MTLIGESLTSHVITLTPILAKILTSDPYNCWPLLLRKSVTILQKYQTKTKIKIHVTGRDERQINEKASKFQFALVARPEPDGQSSDFIHRRVE